MDERRIHQFFEVSILLKGAHALVGCVGGLALVLVSTSTISTLVNALTQDELLEDQHDIIATRLMIFAQTFSVETKHFYAFYLFSHGAIKIVLVVGLLANKIWAYPASLCVLCGFIPYQIYRYSYTHSFRLIVITVFDLRVMGLIWHEYRLVRRHVYGERI
ncbi:MAG: rane protein [Rhodospirillales bacterium]|nr:rane protein [Rhodospirillales bacterium]